jgi:hypothetical protein
VLCFLALGSGRADPLDFWWGPMSPALALALAIIVVGGFLILSRLRLLAMALSFWIVFAVAMSVVAATGHSMTARWHLGPLDGFELWAILAFSPEILVFLFFMLTDPKTVPAGRSQRVVFAVCVALLAAFLVALAPTEFWAKVGVLAALTLACAARPLLAVVAAPRIRLDRPSVALLTAAGVVAYACVLVAAGLQTQAASATPPRVAQVARLPAVEIRPSRGVDSDLDRATALRVAGDLAAGLPRLRRVTLWLEAGSEQFPTIVARLQGTARVRTAELGLSPNGYTIARFRSE